MSNRMKCLAALLALLVPVLVNAGCLVKESTSTLCLEPDGSVRWVVLERDIHATGDSPADRQREEEQFMEAVAAGTHPVALAFRSLGATDVTTRVVAAEWPFAVRTEARFSDIARVWQDYFDRIGLQAQSSLQRSGNRTTWTLIVDMPEQREGPEVVADADEGLESLISGDAPPPFMMRHGQFVDAVGFDISDDGRVAKGKDLSDRDWDKEPRLVLSLTWVAAETVTSRSPR
jgi:hypothetical protein